MQRRVDWRDQVISLLTSHRNLCSIKDSNSSIDAV